MSCKFCREPELINGMNYCPYCGDNIKMRVFISEMLKRAGETSRLLYLQTCLDRERNNNTVEIDGETLIFERIESNESNESKPRSTPIDYSFDLDKIDISKEMAMLQKHYNPFAKHADHISERLEQMKEKENENII